MKTNVLKLKSLKYKVGDIAKEIREYCRSQRDLWRQLPYLALEADGNPCSCCYYDTAYSSGYWCLIGRGSYADIAIDLFSGEIVLWCDGAPKASNDMVLKYAYPRIDELDAEKIIARLKKTAQGNHKHNVEWRNSLRKKLKLKKIYAGRGDYKLKLEFRFD